MNQISPAWDFGVIICTLIFSSVIVFSSYQGMDIANYKSMGLAEVSWNTRIGNPEWDFSKSWATTLTAVGALLSTVLLIPEFSSIKVQSGLSLFFGLLVLIAPLMYTASAKRLQTNPDKPNGTYVYQGTIRMFLVTCTLTIWAVSGELVTVGTAFYKLMQQGFLSLLALIAFSFFLFLTIIYTFIYAHRSIPWTLDDLLMDKITQQITMKAQESATLNMLVNLTQSEKDDVQKYHPPLKNWKLL